MVRRISVLAAILLTCASTSVLSQELTTDAERDWKAVRNSEDVRTKIMAERWFNAIRQQEWSDASGKFKVSAKYVEHDPNLKWVKLRTIRGTGKERQVKDVQIPLDKLSKSCQARVRTISVLAEKIAEAKEEEAKKEAEEEADGGVESDRGGETRGDEPLDEEAMPEEPRDGRGGLDRGLAGMDPREVMAGRNPRSGRDGSVESPPVVTNTGPPLPAVLPPLPSLALTEPASQPITTQAAPVVEAAENALAPDGSQHPTSAEQLTAAFATAFANGDKQTLEKMVYWGELTPELRQLTHMRLLDYAGIAQLHRCNLAVQVEGESVEQYTLSSAMHLSLEFETRAEHFDMDWPIGEVDGKYYLGALSDAAPAERR